MYHLQLRQFPHNLSRFNLTEAQLRAIVEPWAAERVVEIGERKWSPHQAKLTILEGPQLAVEQLAMGRGWRAAQRDSSDVTEQVLDAAKRVVDEAATRAIEEAGRAAIARDAAAAEAGGGDADGAEAAEAGGQLGAAAAVAQPGAGVLSDPLTLGVQLASLLGSDPAALLEAWRAVAAGAPGLTPSESLAVAERRLAGEDSGGG